MKVVFTPEEIQAAQVAFSQPVNPLDPNTSHYSQLLQSALRKMVETTQPDPEEVPEVPASSEANPS